MIGIGTGARILIATKPVDFRKGAEGLAALAREVLGQDPFAGTVIVFRSRRADRIKLITWDGTGLVMVWKALDDGAFKWPPVVDGVMKLSTAQLASLLDGLDWTRVHLPRPRRPTALR
ncbi:MAG: IS66 family insertion sequence element accessory protein TnpB [Novosphingobium sp.]|nr:IS66 family insertion sequence element accessory protein TnpB [Brevundimonas sp.]MCZ8320793.1 IS66 family insertion sequence element accessory protein TnpB [Novosphingobium sp.]